MVKYIRPPATIPMTTAAQGSTNAQDAVMATRPAKAPFSIVGISALPRKIQDTINAATAPAPAASWVLKAT
ncbi:hypothetical protein D3C76_1645450 [compost metagenome]